MISNRGLYDDAYLQNIDNAKNNGKHSVIDRNILIEKVYNNKNSVYKYVIPTKSHSQKFSSKDLYSTGTIGYLETIKAYKEAGGNAIDPKKGSPIDPKTIFNFNTDENQVDYQGLGYLKCDTVGRENVIYLSSAPDSIQESTQTNTAAGSAIGMSQDYNFFTGVSSRVVSFNFDVYADYLPSPYTDVVAYCKALKQMNYPSYSSDCTNSPSVTFVYGGLSITGIPTINITFGNTIKKKKVDSAKVSVSIIETSKITDGEVLGYS